MRLHRKDVNHDEIQHALEAIPGIDVINMSQCGVPGFPDLIVGSVYTNRLMLVEIKTKTGKLRPEQERFHAKHPQCCCVVRNVEEAYEMAGIPLDERCRVAGL